MKTFTTIGLNLDSSRASFLNFNSKNTLLETDIAVFTSNPDIDLYTYDDLLHGNTLFDAVSSKSLVEHDRHWSEEIKSMLKRGKTVVFLLPDYFDYYVYKYQNINGRVSKIAILTHCYEFLPKKANITFSKKLGVKMKLTATGKILEEYWKLFEQHSSYNVVLDGDNIDPCIITNNGDRVVGALYKDPEYSGNILLLPNVDFANSKFYADDTDSSTFNALGKQVIDQFLDCLVEIDNTFNTNQSYPNWIMNNEFILPEEERIDLEIEKIDAEIEYLHAEKIKLVDTKITAGTLHDLLWTTGVSLEHAVQEALIMLGCSATNVKQDLSEFDLVGLIDATPYLGEIEGRDNKSIQLKKTRQLLSNVRSYSKILNSPVKGILFGNPYRTKHPDDREEIFSQNAIDLANAEGFALVHTVELFNSVRHFLKTGDIAFAAKCRAVLQTTAGVVSFPLQ